MKGTIDDKMESLFEFYFILEELDIDSSFYYIQDLHKLGIEERRDDAIALANYCYGHYLSTKMLLDESFSKFEMALTTFLELGNDTISSEVYNGLGNNFFLRGDYLTAEDYYLKAVETARVAKADRFE